MKKYGWLTILTALVFLLAGALTVQAEILPPYGAGQIGLQAVVLCEELTVRREPNAASEAVRTLKYGDMIIVDEQTEGWAGCFLSDDVDGERAGWVNRDYIAIDPAWYRTEEKTPVYAWNDANAPKIALLDADTTLPVLKSEGDWLIVSLRGATGWIQGQNANAAPAWSAEGAEPAAAAGRQDGERFEGTVMLEGMEEAVSYEHIVNSALGFEMDYDYEMLERRSEADREVFVSRYEDPEDPLNWFEVRHSAEDAETAAAAVAEALSAEYDLIREPLTLEHAGNCERIEASCVKGTNQMAEYLQAVYVVPAVDGCIVATVHETIESAEGFGARVAAMMNTLVVLGGQGQ